MGAPGCMCMWHAPEHHEAGVGCTVCRAKGENCGCTRSYAELLATMRAPRPAAAELTHNRIECGVGGARCARHLDVRGAPTDTLEDIAAAAERAGWKLERTAGGVEVRVCPNCAQPAPRRPRMHAVFHCSLRIARTCHDRMTAYGDDQASCEAAAVKMGWRPQRVAEDGTRPLACSECARSVQGLVDLAIKPTLGLTEEDLKHLEQVADLQRSPIFRTYLQEIVAKIRYTIFERQAAWLERSFPGLFDGPLEASDFRVRFWGTGEIKAPRAGTAIKVDDRVAGVSGDGVVTATGAGSVEITLGRAIGDTPFAELVGRVVLCHCSDHSGQRWVIVREVEPNLLELELELVDGTVHRSKRDRLTFALPREG